MSIEGDAQFERLTTEFLAEEYAAHPIMATAMGLHDYDDGVDNFNRFAMRDNRDRTRAYLHAIDKISLADLGNENRLDYRLARSCVQATLFDLEQIRWPQQQPGAYTDILFQGVMLLVAGEFAEPERRAASLLDRLSAIPHALQEARHNLKHPPKLFVELAIEGAESGVALCSAALEPFIAAQADPNVARALNETWERASAAIAEWAGFLRESLLPDAGGEPALGRDRYDYHLRVGHMLSETAESLLAIAKEELANTEAELTSIAQQLEPGSTWQEVLERRAKEHPDPGRLVGAYALEIEQARAFVIDADLATVPDEPLRVEPTPDYARATVPAAAYFPAAPFEPIQQSRFWVTPPPAGASPESMKAHSDVFRPIRILHDTFPGRHLQAVYLNRMRSGFRRHFTNSSLFADGWALYCEDLMWELGFYRDPAVRLAQQAGYLKRVCRMLLDLQLHACGMSIPDAAAELRRVSGADEASALAEVRRLMLTPTQPVRAIMGKRALTALRTEMRRRQGPRFVLVRFNDTALELGSVPPFLLREALLSVP